MTSGPEPNAIVATYRDLIRAYVHDDKLTDEKKQKLNTLLFDPKPIEMTTFDGQDMLANTDTLLSRLDRLNLDNGPLDARDGHLFEMLAQVRRRNQHFDRTELIHLLHEVCMELTRFERELVLMNAMHVELDRLTSIAIELDNFCSAEGFLLEEQGIKAIAVDDLLPADVHRTILKDKLNHAYGVALKERDAWKRLVEATARLLGDTNESRHVFEGHKKVPRLTGGVTLENTRLQESLAKIWIKYVDRSLQLPDTDEHETNEFIKFIRAGLAAVGVKMEGKRILNRAKEVFRKADSPLGYLLETNDRRRRENRID